MSVRTTRLVRLALAVWAVVSYLSTTLPAGHGGLPRAVNAVVLLVLGPGLALVVVLLRSMSFAVAASISIAASLVTLVLATQVLLLLGLWSATYASAVIAATTVVIALVPRRIWGEVRQ